MPLSAVRAPPRPALRRRRAHWQSWYSRSSCRRRSEPAVAQAVPSESLAGFSYMVWRLVSWTSVAVRVEPELGHGRPHHDGNVRTHLVHQPRRPARCCSGPSPLPGGSLPCLACHWQCGGTGLQAARLSLAEPPVTLPGTGTECHTATHGGFNLKLVMSDGRCRRRRGGLPVPCHSVLRPRPRVTVTVTVTARVRPP